MPLLLATPHDAIRKTHGARTIEIALLNNLGDSGLESGERQFVDVLAEAAGPVPVRLRMFSLPCISRGPAAQARIAARYTAFADLMQSRVDGLIVTGAEPRAPSLPQEPIWRQLTDVIDWAEHNTRSTIFSCLAAHAAVLHLDGIDRRRLPTKCSGLFEVERVGEHPLLAGLAGPMLVPHSRWNGLDEAELAASGYDVLTRSDEMGVDLAVKQWGSLFVLLQGHPEYDEGALRGEYRRDVLRFVAGTSTTYPDVPTRCFSTEIEAALRTFEAEIRRNPETTMAFPLKPGNAGRKKWRRALAVGLLRNWLTYLRDRRLDRVA